MPDPLAEDPKVQSALLERLLTLASDYLETISEAPARPAAAARPSVPSLDGVPGSGVGALEAIETLAQSAITGATVSTGPRYYDFVVGGVTPAAMAADWLTALVDQNAAGPGSSAWATELESVVLGQLVDLFGLPPTWSGVLTTSSMSATFTALSCATSWWARHHGADIREDGLSGLPRLTVFVSAHMHPTVAKALQMMGHGRRCVIRCPDDGDGRIDVDALAAELATNAGPAIIVATAGDANTGQFDPLLAIADVAARAESWLHVDAAFGLYAALSRRSRHRLDGLDRADSVAADAHKWLNVPYESAFCLMRNPSLLEATFGMPAAPYLPDPGGGFRGYSVLGPESSRRARSLPIWASLAAYGRTGLQSMIERHLDITRHLASVIQATPQLELMLDPESCIVCFRWVGHHSTQTDLDSANRRLADLLSASGRFSVGSTVVNGRFCLRAALCNWRLERSHVDELVAHVLTLTGDL